ncbi:MAG TPA: DVU0524 family FlgM-associated protein [Humidesulfovibrio sp.]|uniref:DVU0524 family FlgM-associated protein n=1 Tax=Humidesulfovibrio sp. TaxID=2910988 RepID=UPI002C9810C3|nr:DVU0524 family FlgM-associated protein [Humidesulfovibrio sp.]HWR02928.1 DVU0524 family FlgM-associated protein [Humidesulfovibrio sp.]
MVVQPVNVRLMLRTYGKQLTSAKRLARFKRALALSGAQDMVSISREAKRRELVERIAQEVIENLLVNGQDNPVVSKVLMDLEQQLGERVLFDYPLDGGEVQILRQTPEGPQEINPEEKMRIMRSLWEITLSKVDDTML